VVKALIDAKSEINFVSPVNGYTPLMNASFWGNLPAMRLLLAAGADINIKSKLGQTMLAVAVGSSKLEVIKILVAAGADTKEKYDMGVVNDLTALSALIGSYEPAEKVTYIKGVSTALAGLKVTFPDKLQNAKETDYSSLGSMATYLLKNGADPNQTLTGTWGNILNQSIDFGKYGIAKALIDNGATYTAATEIKVKDKNNDKALFPNLSFTNGDYLLVSVMSNDSDFVKFMVDKNPTLVTKSYEGEGSIKCGSTTAYYTIKGMDLLMIAAEHGNPAIVRYLIKNGAGRGDYAIAKWKTKSTTCPLLIERWTMAFAKNSDNQQVIDLVKAAGYTK
jgi:ankyrin repeat protein